MISTTWTDAPAGFAGSGGVALPPYACTTVAGTGVRMAPIAAPVQGTGLPAARLRPIDERGAAHESSLQQVDLAGAPALGVITQNNGTTLGIHPPGRPQS